MPDAKASAGLARRPCFDSLTEKYETAEKGKITVVPNADPAIVARLSGWMGAFYCRLLPWVPEIGCSMFV